MAKTLKEAIGCWTSADAKWNDLADMAKLVTTTAKRCRRITNDNRNPEVLLSELDLLRKRLEATQELTQSAIKRCNEIIKNGETKSENLRRRQERR